MFNDSPLSELSQQGIEEGLAAIGWVKERDFFLKISNAQGDFSTLNLILDGIVNDRPDLVFVISTPVLQAAVRKINSIPVVFTSVADPVGAGAGKSFQDHLPNFTGISTMGDYRGMAGMITAIMPETSKVGTLWSPGEANSVNNLAEFRKYTEMAGIELITVPVNSTSEVADAAMSLVSMKPGLVCQIIDNITASSFSTIIKACDSKDLPCFGFVSDQAEKGAVLVLSRDYEQAGRDAVVLAGKILRGTSPGELPFEFVSKTITLVNNKAAARYGIRLPEKITSAPGVEFR